MRSATQALKEQWGLRIPCRSCTDWQAGTGEGRCQGAASMNRIRKFSRGSGRVLGFIFAASVIWLIFDMAALKLSFSEVNSKLLKEELIRGERGRFKGWQGKLSAGPFHRREGRPAAPGESIHDRFKDRVRDPMQDPFHRREERPTPPRESILDRFKDRVRDPVQDPFHRREERPTILIETNPARFRDRLRDRLHRNKPFKPLDNAEKETNRSNESPKPSFNKTLIPGRAVGKLLESKAPPSTYMHSNEVRRIPGIFINATGLLRTKHTGVKGPQHTPLATESRPTVKLAAPTSAAQKKGATEIVDGPVIADPEKRAADSQHIVLSPLPPAELKRKQDMPSKSSVLQTMPPAPGTAQPAEPERGHIVLVDKIQSSEGKGGRELTVLVAGVAGITPEKHVLNLTAKKAAIDGNKESANKFSSETHFGPAIERIENVTGTSIEHFQTMLRSKERQVSNNKPQDTHNANMVTRKANLSNLYEHNANQGVELGKVNGNDSQQSHKVNQQDVGNALALPARDMGMHKVLTIDVTVSPRDPKAIGQFGRRAEVPKGKEEEAKRRWKEGHFNVYLSDLIPIDRAIDDTRPLGCSEQLVHNDLPTTSVIMCFVDEVWSTLLRSVLSVLNRSPPHLIKEIILVDDFSSKEYLKDNLDRYMSQFPKVRILHLKERYGLIRARLAGANIATGDVLTFLDSHVECNVGWLEPLLESVYLNRRKVACPVIEVVSDKDMSYNTVDNFQRGIFSWPMNFGWKQIPPEEIKKNKIKETDPIRCPVMAGGLFSIDKTYFFELGTYDPGLDVWGGENMELSFKVWMCGGEIEIIPCSRVGHIFRDDNPYSFPKDRMKTVERNLARVAEVWLDEYKELFYGHGYHLNLKHFDVGDLTQQIALRKSLQCRSFKWYLDNVYPDLVAPVVRASGVFKNVGLGKCLSIQNSTVFFDACSAINQNQQFNYTWMRLIKQGDVCLTPMHRNEKLGLHHCDNASNSNKWLHKSLVTFEPLLNDHIVLDYIQPPACLEVDHTHKVLRINTCDSLNHYQKWHFGQYFVD